MRKNAIRQTRKTVTFSRPFTLNKEEGERPAGAYVVETEEQKVDYFFFTVFRRRSTVMHDAHAQSAQMRFFIVDPAELEAALDRDRSVLQIGARQPR